MAALTKYHGNPNGFVYGDPGDQVSDTANVATWLCLASGSSSWTQAGGGTSVKQVVVAPTGGADDTPTIKAAIQAALVANAQGAPTQAVVAAPGSVFNIGTALDFSTLTTTGLSGSMIEGLVIDFSGCEFVVGNSITNASAVNIVAPTGWQFYACQFRFGKIKAGTGASVNGVALAAFNDGELDIAEISGFTASNFLSPQGGQTFGTFNNVIRIGVTKNAASFGFATLGQANPSVIGFQGNTVHIRQAISNATGVATDVAGGNTQNTAYNTFVIGAAESNTNNGCQDDNGFNTWLVNNTNSNGLKGFTQFGTQSTPYIRGYFSDGYSLPSPTAAVVDSLGDAAFNAWTAPTFTNSWVNNGAAGYSTAAYRKDRSGYVHLRGLISGGTLGSSAFTLPAGFRPLVKTQLAVTGAACAAAGIEVDPAGTVLVVAGTVPVDLSGACFLAEA